MTRTRQKDISFVSNCVSKCPGTYTSRTLVKILKTMYENDNMEAPDTPYASGILSEAIESGLIELRNHKTGRRFYPGPRD